MLRNLRVGLLMAAPLTITLACAAAVAQEATPATKEAWVEKLSGLAMRNGSAYQTIQQFTALDPELSFAALRESWPKIKDTNTRMQIVVGLIQGNRQYGGSGAFGHDAYQPYPHLLDVFALVLTDKLQLDANGKPFPQDYQRQQILQEVAGICYQDVSSAEDFRAWRATVGDKPVAEIIRESSRRVVAVLESGDVEQETKTLAILKRLTFYNGTSMSSTNGVIVRSHSASGLIKVRRDAMLEAGLPEALGKRMRRENPEKVRQESVRVLARLMPDSATILKFETDLKRELPILIDKPAELPDPANPGRQLDNIAELVVEFSSDWATDLLITQLQKNAESGRNDYTLTNALQGIHSPRIIPTLIGLLDTNDARNMNYNPYESALRQMAQLPYAGFRTETVHDSLWWRVWWHDTKKRYPPDVQNLPIPRFRTARLETADAPVSLAARRRLERMYVSADPERSYWLVSPGWTAPPALSVNEKAAVANSGLKKLAAVRPDAPGLIVLLPDTDASEAADLDTWMDVADALGKRYFVAVAIRPKSDAKPGDGWRMQWDTRQTVGAPGPGGSIRPIGGIGPIQAPVPVETFASQIVRQMDSNVAIDPARIYLVGLGKAGTAGFSCALQRDTPFRGFCLLSAPFRSALLPPLTAAKSRRFFLALGIQDHGATDTLAAAAESLLKQRGAVVRAERIKGGSTVDAIQQGILWLER